MLYVIITLIVVSIVLFVLSFFMNDKFSEIENDLEQFSISSMQDTYQIKKKLKVLEEELLTGSYAGESLATNEGYHEEQPMMIQKVHNLHKQGSSVEEISNLTNLTEHDVKTIIKHS